MRCRNCREPVRRIEPGEGYDLREYQWTHEDGGLLCGMDPPMAEPEEEVDLLAADIRPARLSADLTLDDGSVVQVPEDSGVCTAGPASAGQVTVRVPCVRVPAGRRIVRAVIRSDALSGVEFGADIFPPASVPPDGSLNLSISSV